MNEVHKTERSSARRPVVLSAVAVVLAAALCAGLYVLRGAKPEGPISGITVATADQPVGAAIYVAIAKGYFEDETLEVTVLHHTSGRDALSSVIEGKADL